MKRSGDVFNLDVFNTDHTAIWPGDVQPEMPIKRVTAPNHIDTRARTRADNRTDLDHFAISTQADRISSLIHTAHMRATRSTGPTRDTHRWKRPAHRFDFRRYSQVTSRQQRRFAHIAHLLRRIGFLDLKATAKIQIRRHIGRRRSPVICVRPGGSISTRPNRQALRKSGRQKNHTICDRLVHKILLLRKGRLRAPPFPNARHLKSAPSGDGRLVKEI